METIGARVTKCNWNKNDDFLLCSIRVKAALRRQECYMDLPDDTVGSNMNERPQPSIMLAWRENSLGIIQECEPTKAACDKLNWKYAGKCIINKMGIFDLCWTLTYEKTQTCRTTFHSWNHQIRIECEGNGSSGTDQNCSTDELIIESQ